MQRGQERIKEAAKLGFKRAVLPAANMPKKGEAGIELVPVKRLEETMEAVLSGRRCHRCPGEGQHPGCACPL